MAANNFATAQQSLIKGQTGVDNTRKDQYEHCSDSTIAVIFLVFLLLSVPCIGYSAYRLTREYNSVLSNPSSALKQSSNVNNSIQVVALAGGLAEQFAPIIKYARASQLEYLDQQAVEWIKDTQRLIMETLKTRFVLVRKF